MQLSLTLDPTDLKPKFQKRFTGGGIVSTLNVSQVKFEMFNEAAQAAIIFVGRAIYWELGILQKIIISPKK